MKTIVIKCSCKHDFQDKEFGQGNRLHNECGGKKINTYRCTVCRTEKTVK